ncbi:MAG: TadE family protein [Anaerolineales bacterium]
MSNFIEKIKSILKLRNKKSIKRRSKLKTRGQSLVEIAISLPFILILLSGLMEFGFMLNYYLSLLDATRESARFYSNLDPFNADGTDKISFYSDAAAMTIDALQPRNVNDTTRKVILDPNLDDVVISVIGASGGHVVARYPDPTGYFQWFGNKGTALPNSIIESRLINTAPNAGILVVEVYYGYHQVLKLPWIKAFMADPSMLHAYTIMPLIAAEPN